MNHRDAELYIRAERRRKQTEERRRGEPEGQTKLLEVFPSANTSDQGSNTTPIRPGPERERP